MVAIGKEIRLERIMDRATGNFVIVPMDHGVTHGPIGGLTDIGHLVDEVAEGGATAVVMHRGMVSHCHRGSLGGIGLIIHLSASTDAGPDPDSKVLVTSVEDALRMGADAVSMQVSIGTEDEPRMLRDLGDVASDCDRWGVPLMAMVYNGGRGTVAHAARVAAELGADIVKCPFPADGERFKDITGGTSVPVVVAGGEQVPDGTLLRMVHSSMEEGGRGTAVGRNIFQHRDPAAMTRAISSMVLRGCDVEEAMGCLP